MDANQAMKALVDTFDDVTLGNAEYDVIARGIVRQYIIDNPA